MPDLEEQLKFLAVCIVNPVALLSLLFIHKLDLNAAIAHAKEKETLKRRKAIIKLQDEAAEHIPVYLREDAHGPVPVTLPNQINVFYDKLRVAEVIEQRGSIAYIKYLGNPKTTRSEWISLSSERIEQQWRHAEFAPGSAEERRRERRKSDANELKRARDLQRVKGADTLKLGASALALTDT